MSPPEPAAIQPPPLLEAGRGQLLLIDVQSGLAAAMPEAIRRRALAGLDLLVRAATALGVPATITEHVPERLGATLPAVGGELAHASIIPKSHFCAAADPAVGRRLDALDRPQVVLAGMETHVCVLQAGLVLAARGWGVHLVFDASAARDERDAEVARARAVQAGIVPVSADMVAFEWLRRADHPARRAVIDAVKAKAADQAG
ncbi:MAG: isochorismatase family protein [Alphaproteobacteria bacterium]|nr:isochorismatase family protein [Alphaproteobacteria bacterium]